MSVFDYAWSLLKNFDEKRGPIQVDPDGIDGPTTQEELDASDTVFYEDYGPVPAADYYNADWHINHPNSHINEDLPPRNELQAQLDKEKEMAGRRTPQMDDGPYFRPQVDDDPFNMKQPDMSGQIEQILAEIQRRTERKDVKNLFNEDGTGKPEFDKYGAMHRDRELPAFDGIYPQDNQLMSSTRPEMDSRMEALGAEMARRAGRREAKRQDEEDPDWPYSVKTFDEENPA